MKASKVNQCKSTLLYVDYQLRVDNQHSVSLARRRSTTVSLETNHFVHLM